MTAPIMIRRATAQDAGRLADIWLETATGFTQADPRFTLAPDGAAQWRDALLGRLAQPDRIVLVAEEEGLILGYLLGCVGVNTPGLLPARYGLVEEIAIDFHAKTGGLGRLLLDGACAWFREQGLTHAEARVLYRQPIAQAFWRSLKSGKVAEAMWIRL